MAEIFNFNPDYGVNTRYIFKNYPNKFFLSDNYYHNCLWSLPIAEINFSSAWFDESVYGYIRNFFDTVQGSEQTFLFKDPIDFHVEPFQLQTGFNAYTQGLVAERNGRFQLVKSYILFDIFGGQQRQVDRPITRPDISTIIFFDDGVVQPSVTIDPNTGEVFGLNVADLEDYSWEGEFFTPVRFTDPILPQELISFDKNTNRYLYSIPDLTFTEVKELDLAGDKDFEPYYDYTYRLPLQLNSGFDTTTNTLIYGNDSGYERRERAGAFLTRLSANYTKLNRQEIEYLLILMRLTCGTACSFRYDDPQLALPSLVFRFEDDIIFSLISSPDLDVGDNDRSIYTAENVNIVENINADSEITTFYCYLWKITDNEGIVRGFTNHDRPLTVDMVEYSPVYGLSSSAAASTSQLNVDSVDLLGTVGATTAEGITEADVLATKYYDRPVEQLLYNWKDETVVRVLFTGTLGETELEYTERDGIAFALGVKLEGISRTTKVDTNPIRQTSSECQHEFLSQGGFACNRVIDSFARANFVVASSTRSQVILTSTVPTRFTRGVIRAVDGRLTDFRAIIGEATGTTLNMLYPLPEPLSPGVTVELTGYCDKTRDGSQGCVFWSNIANYGGQPDLLGADVQIVSPTQP